MRYLFEPDPDTSKAREIGELVSENGETVVLRWMDAEYTRDRRTDFLREVME